MADMDDKASEGRIFAGYVRIRMEELSFSRGDLHRESAVAKSTIARVLNPADDYDPHQKTIRAILDALDGSLDAFRAHKEKIKAEIPPLEHAKFANDPTAVGFEEGILNGWSRIDVIRFCRTGKNKPYLVTRLVNSERRLIMHDFARYVGQDISDIAKALPVSEEIGNLSPNMNIEQGEKDNNPIYRLLTSFDAKAWKLSEALGAIDYAAECPHCGAGGTYTCGDCGSVTCDDLDATYDAICSSCGRTTTRSEVKKYNSYTYREK
jgi:hypothetical protein